jgi:hypothetical protein
VDQRLGPQSYLDCQKGLLRAFQGRFAEAHELIAKAKTESKGGDHKGIAQDIMLVEMETAGLEKIMAAP